MKNFGKKEIILMIVEAVILAAIVICVVLAPRAAMACEKSCPCTSVKLVEISKVCTTLEKELELDEETALTLKSITRVEKCGCSVLKSVLWAMATERNELYLESFTAEQRKLITEYMKTCCHCGESKTEHEHFGGTHDNGGRCKRCGEAYQKHELKYVSSGNTFHHIECSCGWRGEDQVHRFDEIHTYETDGGLTHLVCIDCGQHCWWDTSNWTCNCQ